MFGNTVDRSEQFVHSGTLTWDQWRRVADRLGLSDDGGLDASYRPRWNIAPTDEHFIVTSRFERRVAQRARWGLVNRWARTISALRRRSTPRPKHLRRVPAFVRPSRSAAA